ncbi:FeoA family protein [Azospirillum picis]|uniref:Ferrous iron transport protein A n=1 Tax=Azospirillum picis TaxID=488438 RepID=A0ABU0MDP4_9PROT|nr:FeoA family protein [Azospirillum picis]MBP2297428.1 ferrous iron transport protein A [Azospirillum picis]MDQ0531549.1 ferrous iron transport protein A [Azospirillum picis]
MTIPDMNFPDATAEDGAIPVHLGLLRKGQRAEVIGLDETAATTPLPPGELERRMIEMGLIEGARLEVLHEGFPGSDPIAVRIADHILALRRAEAHAVLVSPLA